MRCSNNAIYIKQKLKEETMHKYVFAGLVILGLVSSVYALSPVKTITVNKTITKQEISIDNITINPNNKRIVIRLLKKEVDSNGNVIRTSRDKVITISDKAYDVVIKAIGINFDKLITAVQSKYDEVEKPVSEK